MSDRQARRGALKTLGLAAGTALLAATRHAHAAAPETGALLPGGATHLADLTRRLAAAPRRRDFKSLKEHFREKMFLLWESFFFKTGWSFKIPR